ncbi:hypothetical protein MATL_G00083640 [Megalops atlanticus]|uniref:Uncharacterized protein n=1 Tax=Megalops atlanticus TaxID=7932 RepID=A0A9D3TF94_MEGAT|nr:hypothetical protein MATL_G00083640 [Megalops atlanticus]
MQQSAVRKCYSTDGLCPAKVNPMACHPVAFEYPRRARTPDILFSPPAVEHGRSCAGTLAHLEDVERGISEGVQ